MTKKLYEENNIQGIANAIREKNGTQDQYTVAQMPAAVRAIKTQPDLETLNVTENGDYTPSYGKDGFGAVHVAVPSESQDINLQEKTVTENGVVTPDTGYDGLSQVTVSVEGGAAASIVYHIWTQDTGMYTAAINVQSGVDSSEDFRPISDIITLPYRTVSNIEYNIEDNIAITYSTSGISWILIAKTKIVYNGDEYDTNENVRVWSYGTNVDFYVTAPNQVIPLQEKTVNRNGLVTAESPYYALKKVLVNIPSSLLTSVFAFVHAHYKSGNTITATDGTSTLTSDESGDYIFPIPNTGLWHFSDEDLNISTNLGVYDYGTSYTINLNIGLPYSAIDAKCFADINSFDPQLLQWGIGDTPINFSSPCTLYQNENAVLFDALSSSKQIGIGLTNATSDFTIYVVAKGLRYANGDVQVIGSVSRWSNGNIINLYHRSGTTWISSIYGNDQALIDTNGDYVAVAIRSQGLKASWFAHDGSNRKNVAYNQHGVDFTFGSRSGNIYSTDLAVKCVAYYDVAEDDATIANNLNYLKTLYNLS